MRCFVAFELGEEAREFLYKLESKLASGRFAKIRWTHKKNLHVTLKFLGDVPDDKMEAVKQALASVEFEQFSLKLNNLGFFPNDKSPNVVWVGLNPEEKAIELQRMIDEELLTVFPTDQKFQAHVTLGRIALIKKKDEFIKMLKEAKIEKIPFEVDSFRLYRSDLTKEGPVYKLLEEFKCKK